MNILLVGKNVNEFAYMIKLCKPDFEIKIKGTKFINDFIKGISRNEKVILVASYEEIAEVVQEDLLEDLKENNFLPVLIGDSFQSPEINFAINIEKEIPYTMAYVKSPMKMDNQYFISEVLSIINSLEKQN